MRLKMELPCVDIPAFICCRRRWIEMHRKKLPSVYKILYLCPLIFSRLISYSFQKSIIAGFKVPRTPFIYTLVDQNNSFFYNNFFILRHARTKFVLQNKLVYYIFISYKYIPVQIHYELYVYYTHLRTNFFRNKFIIKWIRIIMMLVIELIYTCILKESGTIIKSNKKQALYRGEKGEWCKNRDEICRIDYFSLILQLDINISCNKQKYI